MVSCHILLKLSCCIGRMAAVRTVLPAATVLATAAGLFASSLSAPKIGSHGTSHTASSAVPQALAAEYASATHGAHECDCVPLWQCLQTRCSVTALEHREVCTECSVMPAPDPAVSACKPHVHSPAQRCPHMSNLANLNNADENPHVQALDLQLKACLARQRAPAQWG